MNNQNLLLNEINILKQHLSLEYLKHQSLQHPDLIETSQLLDEKINEYLHLKGRSIKQSAEVFSESVSCRKRERDQSANRKNDSW
jgi:hypothetical protein